jgi:hypothetical protein
MTPAESRECCALGSKFVNAARAAKTSAAIIAVAVGADELATAVECAAVDVGLEDVRLSLARTARATADLALSVAVRIGGRRA